MLQTERIVLRDYNVEDLPFLRTLLTDASVVKYIGHGNIRNETQIQQFYSRIQGHYKVNPAYGLKIIEHKQSRKQIGHAGLVPQVIEGRTYIELGYWIAKDYWNQGYATEVACALKNYAQQVLNNAELISIIQVENIASQKVAEKVGMTKLKSLTLDDKAVYIYHLLID